MPVRAPAASPRKSAQHRAKRISRTQTLPRAVPPGSAPPFPDPITREEARARLGRSVAAVRRLENAGRVRVHRGPPPLGAVLLCGVDIDRLRLELATPARGDKGARAALAFELLRSGCSRADLVIRLRADPAEVDMLAEAFARQSGGALLLGSAELARLDAAGLGAALGSAADLVSAVLRLRRSTRAALRDEPQAPERAE